MEGLDVQVLCALGYIQRGEDDSYAAQILGWNAGRVGFFVQAPESAMAKTQYHAQFKCKMTIYTCQATSDILCIA